jgi:hypothetical protein
MLTEFSIRFPQFSTSLMAAKPTADKPSWASPAVLAGMEIALNPTVSAILADMQSYATGSGNTPGSFSKLRSIVVFFI